MAEKARLPARARGSWGLVVADSETIRNHAAFIWSVADLLRGEYKQSEYGKVVLPLTVIRRLDCVLEPTKQAVLERQQQLAGRIENLEPVLQAVAGQQFYNTSPLTFTKLLADPNPIADSLQLYIGGLSDVSSRAPSHTLTRDGTAEDGLKRGRSATGPRPQDPRRLALGCRRPDPGATGCPKVQGLHPPAGLSEAPLPRVR